MVFAGKLLHCWKRHNGFFVSCAELLSKGLLPTHFPADMTEESGGQPGSNFQTLLGNEEIFLSTLPPSAESQTTCHESKKLVNMKLLNHAYKAFPACGLAKHMFRIKFWPHACPLEEKERRGSEETGSIAGPQANMETFHQPSSMAKNALDSHEFVDLADDHENDDVICLGSEAATDAAKHGSAKGSVSTGTPTHEICAAGSAAQQRAHKKPADIQDTDRLTRTRLSTTDKSMVTHMNVLRRNQGNQDMAGKEKVASTNLSRNPENQHALNKEKEAHTNVSNPHSQQTADKEMGAHTNVSNPHSQQTADEEMGAHTCHCRNSLGSQNEREEANSNVSNSHSQQTADKEMGAHTNVSNPHSQQTADKEMGAHTNVSNPHSQQTADEEMGAHTSHCRNSPGPQKEREEANSNARRSQENPEARSRGKAAVISVSRKQASQLTGKEPADARLKKALRSSTSIQPKKVVHQVSTDSCAMDIPKRIHQLAGSLMYSPVVFKFQRACLCPSRKRGVFSSFSFLQCTYSADTHFTILEHVGQAIINRKMHFCFYRLKQVFFSIMDLACAGEILPRFQENLPGLFSEDNQMSQEERLIVSEFGGVSTEFRDCSDQLVSSSTLLQLISGRKGSLDGSAIYLHQVGHICPCTDSLAHDVQVKDSNIQQVQSAWLRAFQWYKEYQQQATGTQGPANSRTSVKKARNRSDKESAKAAEPQERDGVVCVRALVNSCSTSGTQLVAEQTCEFTSISPVSLQCLAVKQERAIKQEPDWEEQGTNLERCNCVDVRQNRCTCVDVKEGWCQCVDVKQETGEEGSELCATQSAECLQKARPRHASIYMTFTARETVPPVCQAFREVDQNKHEDMSPLEGVILDPFCKNVTVIFSEERLKELLGVQSLLYHIVLTGVLTCSNCRYMCLSVGGQLYVNWGEVVEQLASPEDREFIFKQARRLHAFLYQPPFYVNELLSHHYGSDLDTLNSGPWVVVNTLVAIYNLGSGILPREKMLKRFVDITPNSVCFPTFLLISKR